MTRSLQEGIDCTADSRTRVPAPVSFGIAADIYKSDTAEERVCWGRGPGTPGEMRPAATTAMAEPAEDEPATTVEMKMAP